MILQGTERAPPPARCGSAPPRPAGVVSGTPRPPPWTLPWSQDRTPGRSRPDKMWLEVGRSLGSRYLYIYV